MLALCRYILRSGLLCQQAAVSGTCFCRHHQNQKEAVEGMKPQPDPYGIYTPLPFVFPEDRAAIQENLFVVMQALNDKRIDVRTANAYRGLLRCCEMNLSHGPLLESGKEIPGRSIVQRVVLTQKGEEIATRRYGLEGDEALPVHGKECPCHVCAEEFRGAKPEMHHRDCKCGECREILRPAVSDQSSEAGDQGPTVSDEGSAAQADLTLDGADASALSAGPGELSASESRTTPAKRPPSFDRSFCEEEIRAYEAQQAEVARAAREAGVEPPPYKPWDGTMVEADGDAAIRC